MIPATEKQTEILSTFNSTNYEMSCILRVEPAIASHKIYEPSRKSLSERLTGVGLSLALSCTIFELFGVE